MFYKSFKMNSSDDFNKAALDLMGELEAVIQYGEHALNATSQSAKNTWMSIRSEEEMHAGELLALLFMLDPSFKTQVEKGMKEFADRN
ncbi:MAG: rubrerythrin family protein [Christensenellales bacterium]